MVENLMTTIQTILAVLGGITCIAGGVTAIMKLFGPFRNLKAKVEDHEEKLTQDERERKELRDAIGQVAEADKMLCKVLLNLLDHEITGNHIDRLKTIRGELETFIIDNQFE